MGTAKIGIDYRTEHKPNVCLKPMVRKQFIMELQKCKKKCA